MKLLYEPTHCKSLGDYQNSDYIFITCISMYTVNNDL